MLMHQQCLNGKDNRFSMSLTNSNRRFFILRQMHILARTR
ncbi:hypothetical protein IMCC9480_1328 [Oxalobacteraceae bacterium IMCC9480]|nr:hypothetical protein IMCC9480_1328 [Oxalobacteraceae bacterium IMCC9480]